MYGFGNRRALYRKRKEKKEKKKLGGVLVSLPGPEGLPEEVRLTSLVG